jgi:hypothetical protein
MKIFTWPIDWLVQNFSASLLGNTIVNRALFTGAETTVSYLGDKWVFEFTMPLENMNSGASKEAFFSKLMGKRNNVLLHHFARPIPQGTLRGTPIAKGPYKNYLLYSQQFDNAVWSKVASTVTANAANGPDGTSTPSADLIVGSGAGQRVSQNFIVTENKKITLSVYVSTPANASGATLLLRNNTTSTNLTSYEFLMNSSGGSVISKTKINGLGTAEYSQVSILPSYWKLSITLDASEIPTIGDTLSAYIYTDGHSGAGKTGIGDASSIYLWQGQAESGSYATDVILTTSAISYGIDPLRQGSDKLRLINVTPGQTLLTGDLIGADPQLLMCAEDSTANADGIMEVPIVNVSRKSISDGSSIVWDHPKALFKLDSDSVSSNYSTVVLNGSSVKFNEFW